LLEVLGNETRRRILELLAKEPKYLLQLSRELNVSQQAILKHINVLLKAGLIKSYEVKTGSLGPSRKYYELVKPISMVVNLFRGYSEVEVYDMTSEKELPEELRDMLRAVEEVIKSEAKEVNTMLLEVKRLIREIDNKLREIREKERALLNAKCRVLDMLYEYFRKMGLPHAKSKSLLDALLG